MHCDWWMLLAIFQYTALTCSLSHMPINLWDKTIFLLASYSQSILNVTDPHFPHWLTVNALHTEAINQWQKNLVCNSQYIPWTRFIVHNTVEPQFIVKTTPGRTCYYTVWYEHSIWSKKEVNILQKLLVHICYIFSRYSFMETMLSSRQFHALLSLVK